MNLFDEHSFVIKGSSSSLKSKVLAKKQHLIFFFMFTDNNLKSDIVVKKNELLACPTRKKSRRIYLILLLLLYSTIIYCLRELQIHQTIVKQMICSMLAERLAIRCRVHSLDWTKICVEFACSPHAYICFLWVLLFILPPKPR